VFTLRVCYNMDSGCTLTNLEIEPVMLASVLLLLLVDACGKTNRDVKLQRLIRPLNRSRSRALVRLYLKIFILQIININLINTRPPFSTRILFRTSH